MADDSSGTSTATSGSLTAIGLNCTLKPSGSSSTETLVSEVLDELRAHGVRSGPILRVAASGVLAGVTSDEGDGDGWPTIRSQILAADILVLGTPIWMGHPSSYAQRVLERLDAFLGETADDDRPIAYDRVAVVAVVGNEDGAHNAGAMLFQGLNDVGFTIPAHGMTYWVGEAMHKVDYQDLEHRPAKTREATKMAATNAAHLAQLLRGNGYRKESS